MAAIMKARTGIYEDLSSLPTAILERYFTHCGQGYVVNADIRQMVNFSYLDLVTTETPLFTNLDCIFCCNILIYLQRQCQEKVVDMLYQSLATPGYLILGEAEALTNSQERKLETIDAKAKIYKKV
jgi:chemotaxis methyl-accepting protein methylase